MKLTPPTQQHQRRTMPPPPPPPSVARAKLDLLKQLNVYLELLSICGDDDGDDGSSKRHVSSMPPSSTGTSVSTAAAAAAASLSPPPPPSSCLLIANTVKLFIDDECGDETASNTNQQQQLSSLAMLEQFDAEQQQQRPLLANWQLAAAGSTWDMETGEAFVGREWLFKEIDRAFDSRQLVIVSGASGTGKSRLCIHLFHLSSVFANLHSLLFSTTHRHISNSNSSKQQQQQHGGASLHTRYVASNLAAVYCCTSGADATSSQLFVLNLVWSLAHYDGLNQPQTRGGATHNMYREMLAEGEWTLLRRLVALVRVGHVDAALVKCVLEPLEHLVNTTNQMLKLDYLYVCVDGLERSLTITTDDDGDDVKDADDGAHSSGLLAFLARNMPLFPKFVKFLLTVRSGRGEARLLAALARHSTATKDYVRITLDVAASTGGGGQEAIARDLHEYVASRIARSPDIQKNILSLSVVDNQVSFACS